MPRLIAPHPCLFVTALLVATACGSDDSPQDPNDGSSETGDAATSGGESSTTGGGSSGGPDGSSGGSDASADAASDTSDDSSGGADPSPYQAIVDGIDTPGAQLAIIEPDGDMWFGVGGEAMRGEPMTPEHRLLVGSNTKVWTAAATLMLVDEGALSLDDSASTWVPSLDPAITVRNLLQHTSGLGEFFLHPDMEGNGGEAWAPGDLVALGQEVRDDGPGASVYANTNFIALGLILESVEGQPYPEIVQARLLDPLGLESSGIVTDPEMFPDAIAFGDGGFHGVVTPEHPSVGWAAGGGYSTAEDLAEFYRAMLGGELYGDDLLQAQLTSVPSDLGFGQPGVTEAYGLGVMDLDVGGQALTGHLGAVTGFHGWGLRDDASGALAVVLTNNSEVTSVGPILEALAIASSQ